MKSKVLVKLMFLVVVFLFTFTSIWLTAHKVQAQFIFPFFPPPIFRASIETISVNPCLPATLHAEPIITSTLSVRDIMKSAALTPLLPLFIYRDENSESRISPTR